jgi:hypothetical protein
LAAAAAVAVAMLGLGLDAAPAYALNHNTYNILRNAGSHQYCLDIRTEDPPLHARAHLWTCTHPVVGEQLFLLVSDQFGRDHIKVRRSGYCLQGNVTGTTLRQEPCDFEDPWQSWDLRDTGEIVNLISRECLEPRQADTKNADIVSSPCNGSTAQHWLF